MTDRLYYTDAYLTSFDANVDAVYGLNVRLARTAFYPTSGGQLFDTGSLGGSRVTDVVDDATGVIHVLEAAPQFASGSSVRGQVDWVRRFDHMQQHTGQHLLSAVFEDLIGAKTASVHFGADSATLDVEAETVSRAEAQRLESRANQVVAENRAVTVSFEDAASAAGLRKATDRTGEIRIVSIDGVDRSACGGTHVRSTGEIGAVLIRKLEKYKKLTRVEFVCGSRAIARARADYDALTGIAASLSAGLDEVPALVTSQQESLRTMESERRKLVESLAAYRAREGYDAAVPGPDGVRRVIVNAVPEELRALATAVSALPKVAFIGTCDAAATIVFAASDDSGINAGVLLKAALALHGGRGGGNQKVAQGTAPTTDAIRAIVAALTT